MTKTLVRPDLRAPLGPVDTLRLIRISLALALGLRLIYAAMIELVPDESYYWLWSRHLALGYFDHPPMIAYVIWLGTWLFGDREIGVRLVVTFMSIGTILMIIALARRVLHNDRATIWVALIWLTSPLMMGLGLIATPDTPAVFFSTAGLVFVAIIASRDDEGSPRSSPGLWILFGLCCGLATVSKYTAVLLPAAVALAMLTSAKGRSHYRRPWIYLSAILGLLVFSPVIWWNKQHQWASFLYQLKHGTINGEVRPHVSLIAAIVRIFADVGTFLGDQLGLWTPLLFLIVIGVLIHYWRRHRTLGQVDRVLLWAGTFPLVFFGLAVIPAHHTEPNWPAFAYVPTSVLIGRWLCESGSAKRYGWVRGGVQISTAVLLVMLVVLAPPVTRWIARWPFHVPHAVTDLVGWPQFARWIGNQSALAGGIPIVTNKHQDAGEAAFYVPGQPQIWCDSTGTRPTAFDYFFDEQPNFAKIPAVFWVGGNHDAFARKFGFTEISQTEYLGGPPPNTRVGVGYLLVRMPGK